MIGGAAVREHHQEFLEGPHWSTGLGNKPIPEKLKHDAIVEALFEVRFSMSTIPEVFFGRIAEYETWKSFKQSQLPFYQIPAVMRQADPNLRYQPLFALTEEGQQRAVRIGPQAIVYSRGMPYVGWKVFKLELEQVIAAIFMKADDLKIERLGLRYLNALRHDLHGIRSISDLDLKLEIAGECIEESVNINTTTDGASDTACTLRIATTDVIQGNLPPGTSVYVDVDVFTKEGFTTSDQDFVKDWIGRAHTKEKAHFFRLLKESTISSLTEK